MGPVRPEGRVVALIVFWAAAVSAIVGAVVCITRKNPIASLLWLVYAGAIMVLFLFVIMLLNIGRPGPSDIKSGRGAVIAVVAGLLMLAELVALSQVELPASMSLPAGAVSRMVEQQGAVEAVATPLFQQYLIPFEITSVMLLAALVGAVVLAKRKL